VIKMADEKSIIRIIQKMVQDNEPEEKIVKTLQAMGVSEDQSKRLLLIAQADTFTLLSSEIDKIVSEKVNEKQKQLETEIKDIIEKELTEKKKEINSDIEKEYLKNKAALSENQKQFQSSVNDAISKIAKLNEEVYAMSSENKKMIETVEKDLTETKLKGVKVRRSIIRNALLALGILLFGTAAGTIGVMLFLMPFNIDYVTSAIVLTLIGSMLIYLCANI